MPCYSYIQIDESIFDYAPLFTLNTVQNRYFHPNQRQQTQHHKSEENEAQEEVHSSSKRQKQQQQQNNL